MNDSQKHLQDRIITGFQAHSCVLGGFLIGSFSDGTYDDLSDLDICFVVDDAHWDRAEALADFLSTENTVIYSDVGFHGDQGSYARFIFSDFTSCEIHLIGLSSDYQLFEPYRVLFDKDGVIDRFVREGQPPSKQEMPAFPTGQQNAAWDVFNLFKKAVRGDTQSVVAWAKKAAVESQ